MEGLVKLLRVAMMSAVLAGLFLLGALIAGIPGGVCVALVGYISGLPQRLATHISAAYDY